MLPLLEAEARERMSEGGRAKGTQKIADLGESRELAATITGTNRQYVSDAKKLSQESPQLFRAVKAGEKTALPTTRFACYVFGSRLAPAGRTRITLMRWRLIPSGHR